MAAEMGLKYDEFLNLTWKEFDYYYVGYIRKIERGWDYTRNIISTLINVNSKQKIKSSDVMFLNHLDKKHIIKLEKIENVNNLIDEDINFIKNNIIKK